MNDVRRRALDENPAPEVFRLVVEHFDAQHGRVCALGEQHAAPVDRRVARDADGLQRGGRILDVEPPREESPVARDIQGLENKMRPVLEAEAASLPGARQCIASDVALAQPPEAPVEESPPTVVGRAVANGQPLRQDLAAGAVEAPAPGVVSVAERAHRGTLAQAHVPQAELGPRGGKAPARGAAATRDRDPLERDRRV